MEWQEFTRRTDYTSLNPIATEKDIARLCEEAIQYGFRGVCIHPKWVKFCVRELAGHRGILVVSVIDFPLGQAGAINKLRQAIFVKDMGADEIDPVWDICAFIAGDHDKILQELRPLTELLPTKVIVETGHFLKFGQKKVRRFLKEAALLVKESGALCIKTSTGHDPKIDIPTKVKHVRVFKKAEPDLLVKIAGGISSAKDIEMADRAGADIFGISSAAIKILKEIRGD